MRSVQLTTVRPHAAIAITKIFYEGAEVQPGAFEAGNDWLAHTSVVIKNASPSKIVCITLTVLLHQTGMGTKEDGIVGGGNVLGQIPGRDQQPIDLEPGQEVTMPIIDSESYPDLRKQIEAKLPLSSLTQATVFVGAVYFADGSRWSQSRYWHRDDTQPGNYALSRYEDWLQSHGGKQ
jgi:hypothetical protein